MKQEQSQSTQKARSVSKKSGFSSVEVVLAAATFALLVTALIGSYFYGQESTALAGNRARAVMLAEEGLEAVRNIRDANFSNLSDGTHGLSTTGNQWNLSGVSDITGIFTRTITISSDGTNRKAVSCTVSWQQNPQRAGSVVLTSRLTSWQSSAVVAGDCNVHAASQGYSAGTCRQNANQCTKNGETYLSGGDLECTTNYPGNASKDTCCALP